MSSKPLRSRANRDQQAIVENVIYALCGDAGVPNRTVIQFAALTGLRWVEQGALRWGDVDLKSATVTVRTLATFRHRTVPLRPVLVRNLLVQRAQAEFDSDGDFVFSALAGEPATRAKLRREVFQPALQYVSRTWEIPVDRVRWHDLRRFAIMIWMEAGVPEAQIREWAGLALPISRIPWLAGLRDNAVNDDREVIAKSPVEAS